MAFCQNPQPIADLAGQLTNEVVSTNTLASGVTNAWQYDEAGNWLNANATNKWIYDLDNQLLARGTTSDTNWNVTVTGHVDGGTNNTKWYNTWAACRGITARVGTNDGNFSLPNVPLYPGTNELVVTVQDVSGNWTQQVRHVNRTAQEIMSYDGNGNLTNWVSGTNSVVYQWDWADQLTKVTSNNVVVLQNWYDANGRRIAKKEVIGGQTNAALYVWDGWASAALLQTNGLVMETHTRGVGLAGDIGTLIAVTHHAASFTNGTYYTHHNQRGDVVATRNGIATVGTYSYSAFGTLNATVGADVCRFKFSSKERDPTTGLSYYGYRFYAPQWQRWLSRDPLEEPGFKTLQKEALAQIPRDRRPDEPFIESNLYAFFHNCPITLIDPVGVAAWTCSHYFNPPHCPFYRMYIAVSCLDFEKQGYQSWADCFTANTVCYEHGKKE